MKVSLTRQQAEQVLAYVRHRDSGPDCGWYYGSKEHFEKRHQQIKTALYSALRCKTKSEQLP